MPATPLLEGFTGFREASGGPLRKTHMSNLNRN
jgi:hypothetical protein